MPKLRFVSCIPNQTVLFPSRIDEDIAENDPVRVVDAVVERNHRLLEYKRKVTRLLTSEEGIRCIEPEAVFGQIKNNSKARLSLLGKRWWLLIGDIQKKYPI